MCSNDFDSYTALSASRQPISVCYPSSGVRLLVSWPGSVVPWSSKGCSCCRWVRCLAFDHGNEWFVTGSADRTIKVWNADMMTPADEVCQPCLLPSSGREATQ